VAPRGRTVLGPPALLALAACALPARAAAPVRLGFGLDLVSDPADVVDGLSQSRAGTGTGLRVPLRVGLGGAASLRATLQSSLTRGQDRVEWSEQDGAVRYYSDEHWTLVNDSALLLGPELELGQSSKLRPYLAAQVGAGLVTNWHSFHDASAVLLDPNQGDPSQGSYIDPWTRQLAPMTDLCAGLRLAPTRPVAIEVEAGYTISFLDEVALHKARPELGAIRTAYGLNAIRLGLAATFTL